MVGLTTAIVIYGEQGGKRSVVDLSWRFLYILIPSTILMFGLFFKTIEKKYLHTFVSMERGKDLTIRSFRKTVEDEVKQRSRLQCQYTIGNQFRVK